MTDKRRESDLPVVQLAIGDKELAVQARAMLQSLVQWGDQPEVLVSDNLELVEGTRQRVPDVTVVAIGSLIEGDVVLGMDFAPREIVTACQLLSRIVLLSRDRRQAFRAQKALHELARTDAVSGLPNRHVWDETVAQLGHEAPGVLAIAIVDVDQFKTANDSLGYQVGDEILRIVGQALSDNVRGRDLAARIGGDEFGLLLPGLTPENLGSVVERIRHAVVENLSQASLDITVTAGAASAHNARVSDLFQAANEALRKAKRNGGNQAEV